MWYPFCIDGEDRNWLMIRIIAIDIHFGYQSVLKFYM